MVKKVVGALSVLLVLSSLVTGSAMAADFRVPDDTGNVTVKDGEQVKNLYVGGNIVTVRADVLRSLYLGGNVVTVDGNVENDIFIGGGTVVIRGDVGGSVHAGGGTVVIEGRVADDLFAGGGNIMIAESAYIGEDLVVGGGTVDIQGIVRGDLLLGAGDVIINGKIGGRVDAAVGSMKLGENAQIGGDLAYKSVKEAEVDGKAVVSGKVDFEKIEEEKAEAMAGFDPKPALKKLGYVKQVMSLLISMVAGLVLVTVFRKWTKIVAKRSLTNFWPNTGVGFLALVLIPLLVIILLGSVVGMWVGGLAVVIYMLMLLLATPLASISLGALLLKMTKGKKAKYIIDWKAVVVGVVVIGLLVAVMPPLGWLVKFIFMLAALGSLYRLSYEAVRKDK